ncbi:MAG TPA: TonB family protein [Candidatus Acidoferrales bacterium]|nr:TonB family protein [Candidatus Acidoferrales bacterium]
MKKYTVLFFAAMIAAAALAGCARHESLSNGPEFYFKKIVLLTGDRRIEGRYPVSDSVAKTANVYSLSYGDSGRIREIRYTKKGNPANDPSFGSDTIVIDYSNGKEEMTFKGLSYPGRIHSQVFTLDTAGHVTGIRNYDKTGAPVEDESGAAEYKVTGGEGTRTVYSTLLDRSGAKVRDEIARFDSSGNMTEVTFLNAASGGNDDVPESIRYGYDGSGDLTHRELFGREGMPVKIGTNTWKYDQGGEMCLPYPSYEIRDARSGWKYDDHGNLIEEDDSTGNGQPSAKALYVFDRNDNLSKLAYFDGNGKMTKALGSWGQGDDVPPPDFAPVDQEPQILSQHIPAYPDSARHAGIEGRVIVKIWVDKDGKAHKAVVLRSDNPVFNQASINAAMTARFTPAILDGEPVSVWVAMPFMFKLRPR